ncbi:serine hydrolase [Clostridium oryzae]|uniref:Beta-lactamase n=1 Tax=Clostridium oryzae TaxID=1450648 RepID=A0A1V4IA85_9CLOT|nr:serine hydrolase [Clostridium oryzae]OPJ56545.1 beta-lactamase precursor [Clostridium oryzae]
MIEKAIIDYMKNKDIQYSLVIKDLHNDECIIDVNGNTKIQSASIIKLFIMARAFEMTENGELSLEERIAITKKERIPYSIVYLLDENTTYTIRDLITLMIIQSDNTATNVLIERLKMSNINDFNARYGFTKTSVKRKMLDFETREAGIDNETSAADAARFLQLAYKGKLVSEKASEQMLEIMKNQLDYSMMKLDLPDDVIIAHKTGDLTNIKNDVGIVYSNKGDYIFSMFTWNAKSDNYARNVLGRVSSMFYSYFTKGGIEIENY